MLLSPVIVALGGFLIALVSGLIAAGSAVGSVKVRIERLEADLVRSTAALDMLTKTVATLTTATQVQAVILERLEAQLERMERAP